MNDNTLSQEESRTGDTSGVTGSKGKLFLRKNDDVIDDQQDYLNALLSDKKNFEERMVSLEEKLQELKNQRDTIYSDFEHAKKSLLYFLIVYVLVILVQGGFTGIVSIILRLLCIVVTIYFILYFRNKFTPIIINYLVEKESDLIQEYAFRNNMTPIRMKFEDIKREKDSIQLELERIEGRIKLVSCENCD